MNQGRKQSVFGITALLTGEDELLWQTKIKRK